ncbi:hypothetical protein HU200_022410 [Digitaria exilis]|uniref:Myb-like domain-containing protein n=1 Tax=Digitaria exilis TaxID=1010633 RepID=A0A835C1N3_9POAL|nr:hypothetical protein HU200_022410 [Digitaria exilis]
MMKKGKWSKEEDNLIKSHIEKYGVGRSWQALSNTLGITDEVLMVQCRATAVRPELPFPVAELPPPGAEARKFHAGRGDDHLRDVQQEGKLLVRDRCPAPGEDGPRRQELLEQHAQEEVPGGEGLRGPPPPEPCGLQHVNRRWDAGEGPAADFLQQPGELHAGVQPCKPAMAGLLPVQAVQPQALLIAGVQEPITAVPAKIEKTTPPPPPACDQTGMEIVCTPMSPVPLSIMEPDELACIYQFDDIDSFLPWFDDN